MLDASAERWMAVVERVASQSVRCYFPSFFSFLSNDEFFNAGCFAHYPTLHQHDANFSRYEKANEWLVTFDILSASMYSDGDFALSQYLPYTLVPFYPLFKQSGQRVERSQADWEASSHRFFPELEPTLTCILFRAWYRLGRTRKSTSRSRDACGRPARDMAGTTATSSARRSFSSSLRRSSIG